MEHLYIPTDYTPALGLYDTQVAIKTVKDFFQQSLAEQLYLLRVSAPLFVTPESGLNDNLNGVERPVTFGIREQNERPAEIVHSLAKWKRNALKQYGFHIGEGLYTDMSAIRRDEDTDNIHSIYVDQWDWEKIILKEDRNVEYLKETVRKVYKALKKTEKYMAIRYDYIEEILPKEIFFITTQELADLYPDKTPKEREDIIAREKGAVFLMEIGDKLANGEPHDGRAPDCAKAALANDIPVVLGNDVGCPWITQYDFWRELYYFHKYVGVSNAFALYTAAKRSAELAGIGHLTGSIEKGKAADLIVTAENPLEDLRALRNLELVVARGNVIEHPVIKKRKQVEAELDKFL